MSSRAYVNMTPERLKQVMEARRLHEKAVRELNAAVAKALAEREARLKALVEAQRSELAREAAEILKSAGKLETAAEAEARAASEAAAAAERELVSKIRAYFKELEDVSPSAAEGLSSLADEVREGMDSGRMALIFDSVRAGLAKEITGAMRADIFRRELAGMAERPPLGARGEEFVSKAAALMARRRIRSGDMDEARVEYLNLMEEDRVADVNARLMKKARDILSERGYRLLDSRGRPVLDGVPLARDGVYWFAGASQDFRVRAQADAKGGLNLQHLRVVATKDEAKAHVPMYARQLEISESEKWCGAQDALVEALKSDKSQITHTVYRKPGELPLPILVDRDKERFGRVASAAEAEGEGASRPKALEAGDGGRGQGG
ncbi:MAG: hypothetical protein LBQ12_10405 [Deltaproteobacteria bacterium]|jgi:hypothetical protein|nr:hypothetical protein [Deltaproteobacteria bacterium]